MPIQDSTFYTASNQLLAIGRLVAFLSIICLYFECNVMFTLLIFFLGAFTGYMVKKWNAQWKVGDATMRVNQGRWEEDFAQLT